MFKIEFSKSPKKKSLKLGSVGWVYGRSCETLRKSNFLRKGKRVISIKIRNFSRYRMTKWTSPLESSCEI